MKRLIRFTMLLIVMVSLSNHVIAQGIHFSQYNNAPMLLNPANTALMPYDDYRIGVNYRNQWASVPVPFKTTSVFADFSAMRTKNETSWLGLGIAVFDDKVGDGNLALTRVEGFVAYHLLLNYKHAVSAGISAGYAQRSVDFAKLHFDEQWDGAQFNTGIASNEPAAYARTKFADIGAGINYAYIPNDDVYLKVGIGLAHLNKPSETFYRTTYNMALRPTVNAEAFIRSGTSVIVNPSFYYSQQAGAYEALYGLQLLLNPGLGYNGKHQIIVGGFHRLNDAVVGVAGYQYNNVKLTASYDFTVSQAAALTRGNGAFELSIVYQNVYGQGAAVRRTYACPRF